jgi:dual specificity phosphatase 12
MAKPSEFDANLIEGNLWLGSEEAAHSALDELQARKISHILTAGFGLMQIHDATKIKYHKIKAIDIPIYSIINDLPECFVFMDKALQEGTGLLVHCARGISRSATVMVAYLMYSKGISFEEALSKVKGARSIVSIHQSFKEQLLLFEKMGFTLNLDEVSEEKKTAELLIAHQVYCKGHKKNKMLKG